MADGPLIVQSDRTLLLEVDPPRCRGMPHRDRPVRRARAGAGARPHVPGDALGLVNARAARHDAEQAVDTLLAWSRYDVPRHCSTTSPRRWPASDASSSTTATTADCGCGRRSPPTSPFWRRCSRAKAVAPCVGARIDDLSVHIPTTERGRLKQALLKAGWPADDRAGHMERRPPHDRTALRRLAARATTRLPPCGASSPPAAGSSCCRAAPAKPSSGPLRWPS